MTPPDLTGMIEAVERQLPSLSSLQKVLLLTDGSVTILLEAASGERVDVRTIAQDVVPADAVQAGRLECAIGDPVNRRVVNLVGARTGRVFVHAVSFTPLDRLAPGARDDLLAADIPIGRILLRHRMETRRELRRSESSAPAACWVGSSRSLPTPPCSAGATPSSMEESL